MRRNSGFMLHEGVILARPCQAQWSDIVQREGRWCIGGGEGDDLTGPRCSVCVHVCFCACMWVRTYACVCVDTVSA